ncbi:MAG: hypothetical protein WAM77_19425, partial [Xanthobacteraceae bacterium]
SEIVEAPQPSAALILRSTRLRMRLEGWPHTSCMEINVIYAGHVIYDGSITRAYGFGVRLREGPADPEWRAARTCGSAGHL